MLLNPHPHACYASCAAQSEVPTICGYSGGLTPIFLEVRHVLVLEPCLCDGRRQGCCTLTSCQMECCGCLTRLSIMLMHQMPTIIWQRYSSHANDRPLPSSIIPVDYQLALACPGREHLLGVQNGGILSPVPLARHILGWMFKAEEFGTKQLLRQLKAANLLSYAAVEDIITTGMASTSIHLQYVICKFFCPIMYVYMPRLLRLCPQA